MWLCVSAVLLCYPRCDYENLLLSKRLLGDVCSDVLIIDEGLIYDSVHDSGIIYVGSEDG